MGLFLRQDDQRSEVQKRVATELQERLRQSSIKAGEVEPAFLENQHTTRNAGLLIVVLSLLVIGAVIFLVVQIS